MDAPCHVYHLLALTLTLTVARRSSPPRVGSALGVASPLRTLATRLVWRIDYALACARTAYEAGARWVVLCDTNGGTLPDEIGTIGAAVEKVKVEGKTWKLEQGERKIEVELTTMSSNYHVEMNPSDVGTKDRYVVQEVIKDMAKSRPIDAAGQQGYKVLLLNEVDRLSKEAQHGLRRTMEKYSSACRLILICTSVSKVLDAVRSRCLPVRVAAPSVETVEKLVMDVAQKEKRHARIHVDGVADMPEDELDDVFD